MPPPNPSHVRDLEQRFRSFLEEATPHVVGELQALWKQLAPKVKAIKPWLFAHDLLARSGRSRLEDPYTELLAWALAPHASKDKTDPVHLALQKSWLRRMGLNEQAEVINKTATPQTQVVLERMRPDLVLRCLDFIVVVEAKTDSAEHAVPGNGGSQTEAYAPAIRRHYGLVETFPVHVVFLTVDRTPAQSSAAKNATWLDCAQSFVDVLEAEKLPKQLEAALSLLLSHYLAHAGPSHLNVRGAVEKLYDVASPLDANDSNTLLTHATALKSTHAQLCPNATTMTNNDTAQQTNSSTTNHTADGAALLYAQHVELLDTLKQRFEDACDSFCGELVASQSEHLVEEEKAKADKKWLKTKSKAKNGRKAYLWFDSRQPAMMLKERFYLGIYAEQGSQDIKGQRQRMRQILSAEQGQSRVPNGCTAVPKQRQDHLLHIELSWKDNEELHQQFKYCVDLLLQFNKADA